MEWLTKVAKHHNEWVKMVNTFGEYFFAEDIVQETYIMLMKWSSEEKLFKDGNISKGYMWLALKNTFLQHVNKNNKIKFIPLDEMQNRLVVCVCNLKPAKLRGILSEAMVLCASTPDKVELMQPPSNSQPGDRVVCEQFLGESAAECNTKNKIWDLVHVDLKTNDDLIGTYRGDSLVVKGKGPIMSQTLKNVPVK